MTNALTQFQVTTAEAIERQPGFEKWKSDPRTEIEDGAPPRRPGHITALYVRNGAQYCIDIGVRKVKLHFVLDPEAPDGARKVTIDPPAPEPPSNLPYPWCYQPYVCAGRGYCPRDPNCGE
jgi:hypothetical protein